MEPNPTITELIGVFSVSQPNRYRVELPNDRTTLNLLCDAATIPGRNINTNEYTAGGQVKQAPYGYIEDDVNLTFIETSRYDVRRYFDSWIKEVIDTDTYTLGYKNEFSRDIKIFQLHKETGESIYGVNLENAFPKTINSIEIGNALSGELVKVTVTLAYDKYKDVTE